MDKSSKFRERNTSRASSVFAEIVSMCEDREGTEVIRDVRVYSSTMRAAFDPAAPKLLSTARLEVSRGGVQSSIRVGITMLWSAILERRGLRC